MFVTIKSRLIGLSFCGIFLSLCIGVSGYWGLSHVDQQMDHIVLYNEIMRSQLEADMMHDAIWGNVLAAIVETESKDSPDKKALLEGLNVNVKNFRDRLKDIRSKADTPDLKNALEATLPVLNEYIWDAERIGALAFVDRPEALRSLPSFNTAYENLAGGMEQLSDLVSLSVAESQVKGDRAVDFSKRLILALLFVVIVVLSLISVSIVTFLERGFRVLTDSIKLVADGNLTIKCPEDRSDELGMIASQFNRMTYAIASLVTHIKDDILTLASSSEQLTSTSMQMKSNSGETEEQAMTVESVSRETDSNVGTVSVAMEEMSATIKEISRNIQESTGIVKKGVDIVDSASESIKILGEASAAVGDVIKVITSIAEQINLLALNATIEAARAGEAGKGFSVVAHEVKDLAKSTAKATEDITRRIHTIQSKSDDAVRMVIEIRKVIQDIDGYSTNIAGAVEEQSVTTDEITRNVSEAGKGVSRVNKNIIDVVKGFKKTVEGAISVMNCSQEISDVGIDLKIQVEKFRIRPKVNRVEVDAFEPEPEPRGALS